MQLDYTSVLHGVQSIPYITNMTSTDSTSPHLPSNEPQGIFIYGTLMAESLLSWLLTGSSENHSAILSLRQLATLKSYRRVPVKHGDYPALIKSSVSNQVDGFLIIPTSASRQVSGRKWMISKGKTIVVSAWMFI